MHILYKVVGINDGAARLPQPSWSLKKGEAYREDQLQASLREDNGVVVLVQCGQQ